MVLKVLEQEIALKTLVQDNASYNGCPQYINGDEQNPVSKFLFNLHFARFTCEPKSQNQGRSWSLSQG